MSKARLVIGAFIVCSVSLAPVAVIAQQGGTQPQPRVLKRQPSAFMPDRSLGERLQTIDAVVTARVLRRVGVRMIDLRDGIFRRNPEGVVPLEPIPAPFTEYDVTVTEVFKAHPAAGFGTRPRIAHRGGVGQANGVTIDEETHVPQLIEGRQYLFLLNFSHDVNEMQFSEYDVFDISEAKVVANERLRQKRFGKELEGLSTQQALHNIRILLEKP
jgi:hypothetical protein